MRNVPDAQDCGPDRLRYTDGAVLRLRGPIRVSKSKIDCPSLRDVVGYVNN